MTKHFQNRTKGLRFIVKQTLEYFVTPSVKSFLQLSFYAICLSLVQILSLEGFRAHLLGVPVTVSAFRKPGYQILSITFLRELINSMNSTAEFLFDHFLTIVFSSFLAFEIYCKKRGTYIFHSLHH